MQNQSFRRKMLYIGLMVALLLPLSYLSQPAGNPKHGDEGNFRGVLADMREKESLSQTSIGEIDPAGATMQMVLFGFNGVAVNQLWGQAQEAQKKEDWETLRTVLNQLVKLQPHYYKVWDFQAHNLSYNLSVEFDDYRARYKQVINGFNFLKQGIALNQNEPRLPHKLGWYIGHKIGRADEKVFYRQLFRDDWMKLFHETDNRDRPPEQRDNWLVAHEKFKYATELADQLEAKGKPLQTTPSLFYKELSHSLINYAETLTDEGFPEPKPPKNDGKPKDPEEAAKDNERLVAEAKREWVKKFTAAWALADKAFQEYSFNRPFLTPNLRVVKVGEMEPLLKESFEKQNALLELVPGQREKLFDQKINEIADDKLKEVLKKPLKERTGEENTMVRDKARELRISWQELAAGAPTDEARTKAKKLANEITELEEKIQEIDHLRSPLNYNYWRILIEAERNPEMHLAHEATFEAQRLFTKGKMYESARKFEEAFCHWRWVLNNYPYLRNDSVTYDDIHEYVKKYRIALQRGQPGFLNDHPNHFETFPLWDIVAIVEKEIPAENVPFPPLCGEELKQATISAAARAAYEAAQVLQPKPTPAPEKTEDKESTEKKDTEKKESEKKSESKQESSEKQESPAKSEK
jgi:hypothetical protein